MQLHKRFTKQQINNIFAHYQAKEMSVGECLQYLGIGRSRFFALVSQYQKQGEVSLDYCRRSPRRITTKTEKLIVKELEKDYALITDTQIPIYTYNYSAIKDNLAKQGIKVSLDTIINRAKEYEYYFPRKKRTGHHREVITHSIGELIQHDSSLHLWSPNAQVKWSLITSLDDFSRKMLYAHFFERESTPAHLLASKTVITIYGVPQRYYTDQLRTFRFVTKGESFWTEQHLQTDEVNPQWKRAIMEAGSQVIYALSPQAKGKIERPYRWLQDRIVRQCIRYNVKNITEANKILQEEVYRYNCKQVHSTTKEIPNIRFRNAKKEGNSFFFPLKLQTGRTLDDIFCLRFIRQVDSYHKISIHTHQFKIPAPCFEQVEINLAPHFQSQNITMRVWYDKKLIFAKIFSRANFPKVHF